MQPTVGCRGVVVEPVVVVLLQRDEQRGVAEAEHAEEAGVEELGREPVDILVLVAVGTVHESLAHARVALVEQRDQLGILHVRDIGFVPGFAVERFVARHARRRHAHAGDADPAHAVGGDHDGVHLVADIHDARCLVAETVREAREHVATFHDVRIRRDRFHGSPNQTTHSILRPSPLPSEGTTTTATGSCGDQAVCNRVSWARTSLPYASPPRVRTRGCRSVAGPAGQTHYACRVDPGSIVGLPSAAWERGLGGCGTASTTGWPCGCCALNAMPVAQPDGESPNQMGR